MSQIDKYKIILDITEIQKATAKFDITLEQFMSMWYELEPSMTVVLKTDIEDKKDKYDC